MSDSKAGRSGMQKTVTLRFCKTHISASGVCSINMISIQSVKRVTKTMYIRIKP